MPSHFPLSQPLTHAVTSTFSVSQTLSLCRRSNSDSIGAKHMRVASSSLVRACDGMHRRKYFSLALSLTKNEFARTQYKLLAVAQVGMEAIAMSRLTRDFRSLQKDQPPGISADPSEIDFMFWRAILDGPWATAWEGGIY